jgi:hypothetical protein
VKHADCQLFCWPYLIYVIDIYTLKREYGRALSVSFLAERKLLPPNATSFPWVVMGLPDGVSEGLNGFWQDSQSPNQT